MPTVLMCEPRYYDVVYKINPWMTHEKPVEKFLAAKQWAVLKSTIERCGYQVELIIPQMNWPDMVFTANAGLVWDHSVYLSHFRYPERQGERPFFKQWFLEHNYQLLGDNCSNYKEVADEKSFSGYFFEGAGDALFAGNKLFCAYGFRSDPHVYDEIKKLGNFTIVLGQLQDPYFYHLDTCFCPLNEHQAIWWPEAFTSDTQKIFSRELELFAIPENDAKKFACNAVVLGEHVIIPSGCGKTKALLETLKFIVHECDMSEFIKAGGACKCLTLTLV